jgi:hypothetical protein
MYNKQVNSEELKKVIQGMQTDITKSPNYNAMAADIVKQGVNQKNAFRAENAAFKPKGKLLS